jgi:ethanolamine utilization protein EutQ (cupin superfamily)
MPSHEVKNVSASAEVRRFNLGKIELVNIGTGTVGRFEMQKGWKWSTDMKPIVKTEWCEAQHLQYVMSGKLHVKMKDGTEFDVGAGDVASIPPGHDAWVVSNEPLVGVEFVGARIAAEGPKKS